MKFRPCIDIHDGSVKQIVGGSLKNSTNFVVENFVSNQDAGFYADLYKKNNLKGGHIILLNQAGTLEYEKDLEQAFLALSRFPQGLQIGGGVTAENAGLFLEKGASHVICTSYVFQNGKIHYDNLKALLKETRTKDATRLVLDLSCRKKGQDYYIVTNRWEQFTDTRVTEETLAHLSQYCDEFLIHAVDVEGKAKGIETDLVKFLGNFNEKPITYAGGVGSYEDILLLKELGNNHLDVTIGSALDLFGGKLEFTKVLDVINQ